MILQDRELLQIFKDRPTKALWEEANRQRELLQLHVLGVGMTKAIKAIQGHETEQQSKIREKYGKSNRDLFARVLRPVDAIWTARGGGVQYLLSETDEKRLKVVLSNVRSGYNLRRWIRNFWRPRYIDDPMGLILMEVDQNHPNGVYPTYKSSADIFEAQPNGRRLEYLILKTDKPGIFRVIDDVSDRLVEWKGEGDDAKVKALKSKDAPVYLNHFNQVPAIILSDLPKDGRPDFFASPILNSIELADTFLREGSITALYRFKFGFAHRWKYPEVCGTCKGTKAVNGAACRDCNGSGLKLINQPGDVSVFAWPTRDEPEISEKGGFISPPMEYLEYADKSLVELERLITRTEWGTYLQEDQQPGEKETATGRFIDVQPVENRLGEYAHSAEEIERFISNMTALFLFSKDEVTSASLGRRFMIENADKIWLNYLEARSKGAPLTVLKDNLRDYYETKHQGNQQEQDKYLKLIDLEPAVNLTIGEAKNNLPYIEYIKKLVFDDFVSSLPPAYIINTPLQQLKAELLEAAKNYIKQVEDNPDPAMEQADPAKPGGKAPARKPQPAKA